MGLEERILILENTEREKEGKRERRKEKEKTRPIAISRVHVLTHVLIHKYWDTCIETLMYWDTHVLRHSCIKTLMY